MKTRNLIWAAAAAVTLALGACQNDVTTTPEATPEEVSLNFSLSTDLAPAADAPATRAIADNGMDDAALVGVYFAQTGATALTSDADVTANSANRQYTHTGKLNTGTPVYWNDYTTALDIYAYSPYKATAPLTTDGTGISWTTAADQSGTGSNGAPGQQALIANDLLISSHMRALTYTANKGGTQTLTFHHTLAKLRINIVDNSATTQDGSVYLQSELSAATALIKNLETKCDVTFVNQTATEAGATTYPQTVSITTGNTADITPYKWSAGSTDADNGLAEGVTLAATFEAICVPQTINQGDVIAIVTLTTADGLEQNYSIRATGADYLLQQGANNIVNVTLTKSGIQTAFTVKEWTPVSSSQSVIIDNLAGGNTGENAYGDITPAVGDVLSIAHMQAEGTPGSIAGAFRCTGVSDTDPLYTWQADPAFYWDSFTYAAGSKYNFAALYTPAANGTPEKDYLTGSASAFFGAPLHFADMEHIMSRLTVKLTAGDGHTSEDMKAATVVLLKAGAEASNTPGYSIINAAPQAGVTYSTKAATADLTMTHNTTAEAVSGNASGILNSLTLCPQTWAKGQAILTVTVPAAAATGDTEATPAITYTVRAGADGFQLVQGEHKTFTITISKTEIKTAFTVTDWNESSNDGDGELDDPANKKN